MEEGLDGLVTYDQSKPGGFFSVTFKTVRGYIFLKCCMKLCMQALDTSTCLETQFNVALNMAKFQTLEGYLISM